MKRKRDVSIIPVRLPTEVVSRLDRLAERLRDERPGVTVSRSDAIRVALIRGLDGLEGGSR